MHDPGGERVYELDVELTDDDYVRVVAHTARRRALVMLRWAQSPSARVGTIFTLLIGLLLILGAGIWALAQGGRALGTAAIILFIVMTPLAVRKIVPSGRIIESQASRITRRALASGSLRLGRRTFSVGASEDGITKTSTLDAYSGRWTCVDRIEADPEDIYIYFNSESAFHIPRRCFSSHEESEQFLADAETWLKAARSANPPPHPVGPSEVVRFE